MKWIAAKQKHSPVLLVSSLNKMQQLLVSVMGEFVKKAVNEICQRLRAAGKSVTEDPAAGTFVTEDPGAETSSTEVGSRHC